MKSKRQARIECEISRRMRAHKKLPGIDKNVHGETENKYETKATVRPMKS